VIYFDNNRPVRAGGIGLRPEDDRPLLRGHTAGHQYEHCDAEKDPLQAQTSPVFFRFNDLPLALKDIVVHTKNAVIFDNLDLPV